MMNFNAIDEITEIDDLRELARDMRDEIARLREALATIASEMEYPNPLECGFVHSRMNLKDAAYRVDIAKTLAMHTLSAQTSDNGVQP